MEHGPRSAIEATALPGIDAAPVAGRAIDHPPTARAVRRSQSGSLLLLVVGAAVFLGSIVLLAVPAGRADDLLRTGAHIPGTVTRVHRGSVRSDDTIEVRFEAKGVTRHATIRLTRTSPTYHLGQFVDVLYDPDDPTRVRTTMERNEAPPGLVAIGPLVGPLIVGVGVAGLVRASRRRRALTTYRWRRSTAAAVTPETRGVGATIVTLNEAPGVSALVRLRPARRSVRHQVPPERGPVWVAGELGHPSVAAVADGAVLFDAKPPKNEGQRLRWLAEFGAEPPPSGPSFPRMLGWAALVLVAAAIAGGLFGLAVYAVPPHSTLALTIASHFGLYAVLLWACRWFSRRYGTGNVVADFGLRIVPADLGRGLLVALAAFALEAIVAIPLRHTRFNGTNTDTLKHFSQGAVGYAVLAVVVVLLAPVMEELFFRGVLLRGFAAARGPIVAILMQVLFFGVAHIDPYSGLSNLSVVLSVTAIGLVLGWSAHHYGRLGPGMVAHGLINLLVVVTIATG